MDDRLTMHEVLRLADSILKPESSGNAKPRWMSNIKVQALAACCMRLSQHILRQDQDIVALRAQLESADEAAAAEEREACAADWERQAADGDDDWADLCHSIAADIRASGKGKP